ncbi:MAG TPA: cytochrome c oxidase assembly protein [Streptosporangiaceae bacterium]|nr:cytochrome c oxidase assembly protein [Streptosporangiaceae bacterium]
MNLVVSHWSANGVVLGACLLVTAVHVAGLRGLRADARRGGPPLPPGLAWQAAAFYGGLLAVLLALVSPLGYWSGTFIWIRTLQDILLGVFAPPLIVLGAPWLVLRRGLGRLAVRPDSAVVAEAAQAAAAAAPARRRQPPRLRSWPVAVTALFILVWCGWYLPALYDAGVRHPVVLAVQAVSYLVAGVLFWLQLIGSRPFSPRFAPLYRVMLIAAVVLASTVLGMVLGFGANVMYPAYLGVGHHHVLSVTADQQQAGAELWVLVLLPYVIAGVALLIQWLNDEESEALSASLDRMLRPSKSAWPPRTGLR